MTITNTRQVKLLGKVQLYASALNRPGEAASVLRSLLLVQAARLSEKPLDQHALQEIDMLLMAVKKSPLATGLDFSTAYHPVVSSPIGADAELDPWNCGPGLASGPGPLPELRFDPAMYRAALAYYGLPADYRRVSKSVPTGKILPNGKPETTLLATTPAQAGQENKACWVVVNEPRRGFSGVKPGKADIAVYHNLTLDFEYPAEPERCHAIGAELALWLVEAGLAEPGLPVEDSGAGAHICLPMLAIPTAECGGGELVNEAVSQVVHSQMRPAFERIARRYQLEPGPGLDVKLEAFDIPRIFSLPGTWRPGGNKPNEASRLLPGYLRRWLPPYDQSFPERRECETLAQLVRATCIALLTEKAKPQAPVAPAVEPARRVTTSQGQTLDVAVWLEDYARRHPPRTPRKNGSGYDRSVYFNTLVWAFQPRFGPAEAASLARQYADLIDRLAGGKYGSRASQEVERSLRRA